MADFRLPELKPANVDYVNAFAKGYAAPDVMQAPGLANALTQQKIAEKQRELDAAEEYGRTQDINVYGAADPIKVETIQLARQKQLLDSVKSGLDFAYASLPTLTPENYQERLEIAISISPALKGLLPPDYNKEAIDKFAIQYGNMKKLESQRVPYWGPDQSLLGYYPKGGKQLFASPEQRADAQVRVKQTPGAGTGGGRPDVITEAKRKEAMYQEEKKLRPDLTRLQFFNEIEAAKQAGRATDTTITKPGLPGQPPTVEKIEKRPAGKGRAPQPAGVEVIPTADDVPPGTRRKAADGTYWQNVNGVISKVQ